MTLLNAETRSITIQSRVRPLRFAFLVRPDDKAALLNIFQINTCLWGGRFNGIIPIFQRIPLWWGEKPLRNPSSKDIVRGFLTAFEPDYVVTDEPELTKGLIEDDFVLKPQDLISAENDEDNGQFGLNVVALYRDLYEREFQFVKRHTVEVINPTIKSRSFSLFSAAIFGVFPTHEKLGHFKRNYNEAFGSKTLNVDASNFFDVFLKGMGTPLGMGSSGLDLRRRGWSSEPKLFYMDAAKPMDLIDYWNLRALGWHALLVP